MACRLSWRACAEVRALPTLENIQIKHSHQHQQVIGTVIGMVRAIMAIKALLPNTPAALAKVMRPLLF